MEQAIVISVHITHHALFGCTQTPGSPTVWCSCQLNMKPAAFLSGQRRCPAQSLCGPSGSAQSPLPHSPTPEMTGGYSQLVWCSITLSCSNRHMCNTTFMEMESRLHNASWDWSQKWIRCVGLKTQNTESFITKMNISWQLGSLIKTS